MTGVPLLSIIVPHHNRPDMLEDLLSSIPDDPGLEVIVIDDHSSNPPRPKSVGAVSLLTLPDGQRFAGAARNLGIEAARGAWLLFADSDDLFDKDALRRLLDIIDGASEDVLHMPVRAFRVDNKPATRHLRTNAVLTRAADGDPIASLQLYAPWSKVIKRKLVEDHDIRFEAVRYSNDVIFSLRVALKAKSQRFLDEPVYFIREGNPSLTSCPTPESIAIRLSVLRRYNRMLRDSGHAAGVVPAAGQLKTIVWRHPVAALWLAAITWVSGDPVLVTRDRLRRGVGRST